MFEILFDIQGFSSEKLVTQGMMYPQRCFRQCVLRYVTNHDVQTPLSTFHPCKLLKIYLNVILPHHFQYSAQSGS
jgi:hypothetical protein